MISTSLFTIHLTTINNMFLSITHYNQRKILILLAVLLLTAVSVLATQQMQPKEKSSRRATGQRIEETTHLENGGWYALKITTNFPEKILEKSPVKIYFYSPRSKSVAFITVKNNKNNIFIRRIFSVKDAENGNITLNYKILLQNDNENLLGSGRITIHDQDENVLSQTKDYFIKLKSRIVDGSDMLNVDEFSITQKWWHFPEHIASLQNVEQDIFYRNINILEMSKPPQAAVACINALEYYSDNKSTISHDYAYRLHRILFTLGEVAVTEKMYLFHKYNENLKSDAGKQFTKALKFLLEMRGHPESKIVLPQLLKHHIPRIQLAAAGCLGQQGDDSGLDIATRLLQSDNPVIRADAGWAIGKIQDKVMMRKAYPLMLELLPFNGYPRNQAMHAIANFSIPEITPTVITWIDSPKPGDRIHATMAIIRLIRSGQENLINEFNRLLHDKSSSVRRLAVQQVRQLNKTQWQVVETSLKKIASADSDISIRLAATVELKRLHRH